MRTEPPALARLLIVLTAPAGPARDGLIGDLHEFFIEKVARDGKLKASLWYWGQASHAASRYALERLSMKLHRRAQNSRAESRRTGTMETLVQDLRYASRSLAKSPMFTIVSASTIALGIGATTTVFSLVNSVLLKPPPGIENADQLVRPHRVADDGSSHHEWSYQAFLAMRDAETGLADLAAMAIASVGLQADGVQENTLSLFVSHSFFGLLGIRPALGRFFLLKEDDPDSAPFVAVISHGLWKRRFGTDSSIVGSTVRMNGHEMMIVGVGQEGFIGPNAVLETAVWLPLGVAPEFNDDYAPESFDATWLDAIGRRKPDVSIERVREGLALALTNIQAANPGNRVDYGVEVDPYGPIGRDAMLAAAAFALFLFAASGTILLIASVNVGGMLLSRASRRGKEVALRLALGAGRFRVVRQLLTESMMLFTLGGAGGLLITSFATKFLSSYRPPFEVPLVLDFAPDSRALLFSLALSLATGVLFGLAPALQVTRPDLNTNLKGDSMSVGTARGRLRGVFVVAQVAGSALLLVEAGLFARGLARVSSLDPGFDPAGLHALSSELGLQGDYSPDDAARIFNEIAARAAALPQVESSGLIDYPPVSLGGQATRYLVVGREPLRERDRPTTDIARISAGLLETLRIPVIRGRSFNSHDREGVPPVAIVNETFASREWPNESALGKRIQIRSADGPVLEIVGVARNAKYRSLSESPRTMVYIPYEQNRATDMAVLVRVRPGAEDLTPLLDAIVQEVEPNLLIDANTPYENFMGIALLPSRFAAVVTALFGLTGLGLASLGLYGILAYTVSQRTREIGIRIALGAGETAVRGMVLRYGARLAGIGLTIGFLVALGVTRMLRGLLHGLSPTDPVTFAGIAAALTVVALVASYIPARRATRTDPIEALRVE